MARWCTRCCRSFPTDSGYKKHCSSFHRFSWHENRPSTFRFHPRLNARPCDENGNFLPPHAEPPPLNNSEDWYPFLDRPTFEFAKLQFEKIEASRQEVDSLLKILAVHAVLEGSSAEPMFRDSRDLEATIDDIPYGKTPWSSFQTYTVHTRDSHAAVLNMAGSADFDGKFDYVPFEEYTAQDRCQWSNLMSGHWAYKQADTIADDPRTHGSMLVPIILGADKMTVSIATGHQEFHPVYMSLGNIHNDMRRAHREAVIPPAFLCIPKASRQSDDTDEFRLFKKQLYHASLAHILSPLRSGMTTPEVIRCPDRHFHRAIFELGPFIADYPEQVYLAGIVSGWCPKCRAPPDQLAHEGPPRFRVHTEALIDTFDADNLWDAFGIVGDVIPFTNYFPRADIHELLIPDLLHQLIKGTFKDHLVEWVEDYIYLLPITRHEAKAIMDDIDRRVAAVPAFPGLRHFHEGRNFEQWTGDDSKAFMKVWLPAIVGHVHEDVVKCVSALLDFCYLAHCSSHDTPCLVAMEEALQRFHTYRAIFEETGVRPNGFFLPCQHALVHYVRNIKLFGSPNGLCSSITESRHITAVKRPWRCSNRNKPLNQMIQTNTRLSKLAAAWVEFGRQGMLKGDVAAEIGQPSLPELICRFLYDQLYPDDDLAGAEVPLAECPVFQGRVSVYHSASATFYAPSELAGPGGMHRELIRSNPAWLKAYPCFDTVLVQNSDDTEPMGGMIVGRVIRFLSFVHDDVCYPCALMEWLVPSRDVPDPLTGMWVVEPEVDSGRRTVGLIHTDCIVRACHLIGRYGSDRLPLDFDFTFSLDAFKSFYLNKYADYHSHECIP
ncbi:hypothetical protein HYDPIDRAFT_177978 [Hydnomerulius pinastri MD-312]|uniref:C2H2-type domain-containing protein n=1 Tax=Hydnomerulius pinastri MD-312 TaxID=994086 RepID=A0A0C9V0V6_9AGAM|nr:hypothetical protein HYDPIDRAFT_177978 [Hydnomerulius pinastri MD-312]